MTPACMPGCTGGCRPLAARRVFSRLIARAAHTSSAAAGCPPCCSNCSPPPTLRALPDCPAHASASSSLAQPWCTFQGRGGGHADHLLTDGGHQQPRGPGGQGRRHLERLRAQAARRGHRRGGLQMVGGHAWGRRCMAHRPGASHLKLTASPRSRRSRLEAPLPSAPCCCASPVTPTPSEQGGARGRGGHAECAAHWPDRRAGAGRQLCALHRRPRRERGAGARQCMHVCACVVRGRTLALCAAQMATAQAERADMIAVGPVIRDNHGLRRGKPQCRMPQSWGRPRSGDEPLATPVARPSLHSPPPLGSTPCVALPNPPAAPSVSLRQ